MAKRLLKNFRLFSTSKNSELEKLLKSKSAPLSSYQLDLVLKHDKLPDKLRSNFIQFCKTYKKSYRIYCGTNMSNILVRVCSLGIVLVVLYNVKFGLSGGFIDPIQIDNFYNVSLAKEKKEKDKQDGKKEGVTFDDVCGNEEAKEELMDIVDYFRNNKKYQIVNAKVKRGVLLVGPPGCGKTLLARAIANESDISILSCNASDFDFPIVGGGAARVQSLFRKAKELAPCIIYIDEIENLSRGGHNRRSTSYNDEVNELLIQMDGFSRNDDVVVIGSTNKPQLMDEALKRSGRFDRTVNVDLPSRKARRELLQLNLRGSQLAEDVDLDEAATESTFMTGADLANMANTAKIRALKDERDFLTMDDLRNAAVDVSRGLERLSMRLGATEKRRLAVGEAGYAIASRLRPAAEIDFRKASIVPRGLSLNSSHSVPAKEQALYLQKKENFLAKIDVLLAASLAEEIILGPGNVGNSSRTRLLKATDLSKSFVGKFGMDSQRGLQANAQIDAYSLPSETRSSIDKAAIRLLRESEKRTKELLERNRTRVRLLSEKLFVSESVSRKEVDELIAEVPQEEIDE